MKCLKCGEEFEPGPGGARHTTDPKATIKDNTEPTARHPEGLTEEGCVTVYIYPKCVFCGQIHEIECDATGAPSALEMKGKVFKDGMWEWVKQ